MDTTRPDTFLWGVATSAYQIEGGLNNDMSDWEFAGRFWQPSRNPRIGQAVDHWNRWEEDFQRLLELGVNGYRFSLAWSRIEPEPDKFDDAAIERYRRMIDWLCDHNIKPMVTLHHFTHPQWFHQVSPWHEPTAIERFEKFVTKVTQRLLDRVPLVVTFNEPLVWQLAAYGDGVFPPGQRDFGLMMKSLHNMLLAHRRAYDCIKQRHPACAVGLAHNFIIFKRARRGNFVDDGLKRLIHAFYNLMIPETFRTNRLAFHFPFLLSYNEPIDLDNRIDFWGVNYYYRLHVRFRMSLSCPFELLFIPRSGLGQSDLGWEIYPKGLRRICKWLRPAGRPIIITENGIAAHDDELRIRFLRAHLRMVARIRRSGYPLAGYFHWSLLDNYEWLVGRDARFGLYHVDFNNEYRRTLKQSGAYYRDWIKRDRERSAKQPR